MAKEKGFTLTSEEFLVHSAKKQKKGDKMTENLKIFLEEASKDAELTEKISKAETLETIISLASEKGFTLTEEELKQPLPAKRLSDDELEIVAGGKDCMCVFGGGGEASAWEKTCACVVGGGGELEDGKCRCVCVFGGAGGNREFEL